MPTIVMFWDEKDIYGTHVSNIRIENPPMGGIAIPPEACGFRLGRYGEEWPHAWHFAAPGLPGKIVSRDPLVYSSSFFSDPSPGPIEARGPVRGCAGKQGTYTFTTPLAEYGVTGVQVIADGAGSFWADFISEDDITWLTQAGDVVPKPIPPEDAKLEPDIFDDIPLVTGCFLDGDNKWHCPADADSSLRGGPASLPPTGAIASFRSEHAHVALVKAAARANLPTASEPAGPVEMVCPSILHLTITFLKAAGAPSAWVHYRIVFASGQVSTKFSLLMSQDGANIAHVEVPIPLKSAHSGPSPGIGSMASTHLAIHSLPATTGAVDDLRAELLPKNRHRGSLCVEITNIESNSRVRSGWMPYDVICVAGSERPTVVPGLRGTDVLAAQAALNRWLSDMGRQDLVLDGDFGPRTELAVKEFQADQGLPPDGKVESRTWRMLLTYPRRGM